MKKKSPAPTHEKTLHRIARIAGQVQGIRRMVAERKYCIDIVTQIQATRSALHSLELQILQTHMSHCVSEAFASGSSQDAGKKMAELLHVMKKQY